MKCECSQGYTWILTGTLTLGEFILKAVLAAGLGLVSLDQIADALRIALAVAMTGNGIGAAGGLNHDLGPENAG